MNEDELLKSREDIERRLISLILRSEEFSGAILIGSVAAGTSDVFSDLDFYLFYEGEDTPTQAGIAEWLAGAALIPSLHYWTGLEKNRLLVEGVRIDIAVLRASRIDEIREWPDLFFEESNILKDKMGAIARAIAQRTALHAPLDTNDRSAFVLNLLNVAVQIARGEILNARSRFTGVLESATRQRVQAVFGTGYWREPTRHAEYELKMRDLQTLYRAAFLRDPEDFRDWVASELLAVATDESLAADVRDLATLLARRVGFNELPKLIRET